MTEIDMKPLQRLRGEELKEINEAIVEGYDLANWSRALRYNWGIVLGNYVDTHQGFNGVVADLIAWTEQKGKTRELLALAFAQNPENEGLIKVAAKYGITRALLNESSEEPSTRRKPQSLEAMVSSHSRLVNYARFLARLQGVGERVCLVKTPAKKGTGFLVAPDCVLTNFHVVEDVIRNMALIDRVICQFNFQENEDLSEQPHQSRLD